MKNPATYKHEIPLSSKILEVPKSATLAINEKSRQLILEGKDVIRLGLGQSPFPVPDIMVTALKEYASAKDYMAVQGYLPLREAIASFINRTEGLNRHADNVIIGPGSKELFFGLQAVLDCDLVLPAPSWVSYEPQARLLGKTVHWLPCKEQDGMKLTASTLEKHCQSHTSRLQLLILNSPNNPSGACFNEQELKDLARVAARHDVIVLSDEIYSELHYSGQHVSIARYYPERTIISNGISKWAGAGGWRLGFFMLPEALSPVLDAMVVMASETFTSVSAPIQMASISAFEDSSEILDYIHASRKIMRAIGTNFSQLLNEQGITVVTPQGGFYNLADFSKFREQLLKAGITDARQLSQQMLQATAVAALPGLDFGMQGLLLRFAFVDFDGSRLLQRVLSDDSLKLDTNTTELKRIFSATNKVGEWINSL